MLPCLEEDAAVAPLVSKGGSLPLYVLKTIKIKDGLVECHTQQLGGLGGFYLAVNLNACWSLCGWVW